MEYLDFLPIGTVVVVKGGAKRKLAIIARGLATKIDDKMKFFFYGGCFYPEGLIGAKLLYFNREDIEDVVYLGYSDENDKAQIKAINEWICQHDMDRGSVEELKAKLRESYKEASENASKAAESIKDVLSKNGDSNN